MVIINRTQSLGDGRCWDWEHVVKLALKWR